MDEKALRQQANELGLVAAVLTQQAFDGDRDMEALMRNLDTLRATQDICRNAAKVMEAEKAKRDPKARLCLGCKNRQDQKGSAGGLTCALGYDTRDAEVRGNCEGYKAVK